MVSLVDMSPSTEMQLNDRETARFNATCKAVG